MGLETMGALVNFLKLILCLRDIREGFVGGGGLYTLRTRGRPLRTRGVGGRTNGHASCDRARGRL